MRKKLKGSDLGRVSSPKIRGPKHMHAKKITKVCNKTMDSGKPLPSYLCMLCFSHHTTPQSVTRRAIHNEGERREGVGMGFC